MERLALSSTVSKSGTHATREVDFHSKDANVLGPRRLETSRNSDGDCHVFVKQSWVNGEQFERMRQLYKGKNRK